MFKRSVVGALILASASVPASRAFYKVPVAFAAANKLAQHMSNRRSLDFPLSRALSPSAPGDLFRMFDDLDFPITGFRGLNQVAPMMSIDVKETKEAYQLYVDVPGVDKKDIDIKVKGHNLVISAHREAHKKEEGEHYHRVERSSGHTSRTFTLPDDVNQEDVHAESKDGVLVVSIKKKEDAQKDQEKKIEIQ